MQLHIKPSSRLTGEVTIPPSKSHTIRALVMATMVRGTSVLHNILAADDVETARAAMKSLGAEITDLKSDCHEHCVRVKSPGLPLVPRFDRVHTGNSGITMNFVLPMLGLRKDSETPITIDCGDQMKRRPVQPMINALVPLGMNIQTLEEHGQLPAKITRQLKGGVTHVEGSISQYVSALLLSCVCAEADTEIIVDDLLERPYVDMTLALLNRAGMKVEHTTSGQRDTFRVHGGQQYQPFEMLIPGDFSSAATFIAAGVLLPGEVMLKGLDMDDNQGDKALINILKTMGADIQIESDRILCRGGRTLHGATIDACDIPDLLPTLAVIGTQAEGVTQMTNVAHARLKETDRIHAMNIELTKMSAKIEERSDGLRIIQSRLGGARLSGYHDHRTVMALSLAGLLAQGSTEIDTAEAINKTFPSYCVLMNTLGANLNLIS